MTADSKDTIYIDVDEEITGIVSKVQNSPKKIVALVLPKRASVLQSIVNMKLLKRAAEQNDKKLVLITSEARILPLAGAAGLYVASNLNSKPYIPPSPKLTSPEPDKEADVGEVDLAPKTPAAHAEPSDEIKIDNTSKATDGVGKAAGGKKGKGGKKPKVPNFSSFRKKLILGGVIALVLIFGLIYALFIAPKAKVTVKAQTKNFPITLDFTADTKANEADVDSRVVRASSKETHQKNESEKVEATGQKDKGNKASGTVKIYNCNKDDKLSDRVRTVPAGTGISSGGFTFVTSSAVNVEPSGFNGDNCKFDKPSSSVGVTAQSSGDSYNLSARSYSVAGQPSMSAEGSQMSGGTTQIVKVVSQGDIDKAKERLNGKGTAVQEELKKQLEENGYLAINESFKATPGNYTISPAVNSEASEVTVSVPVTYSLLGVKEDDLKQIIKDEVGKTDEGAGRSILSEGLSEAVIKSNSKAGQLGDGQSGWTIQTTVVTGPEMDEQEIKQQISGKKAGEAENILSQRPGIEEPKVELSPFWVGKVPKKHSKITIEVQQADGSQIPE